MTPATDQQRESEEFSELTGVPETGGAVPVLEDIVGRPVFGARYRVRQPGNGRFEGH